MSHLARNFKALRQPKDEGEGRGDEWSTHACAEEPADTHDNSAVVYAELARSRSAGPSGGQVYVDGVNLNALVGYAKLGKFGAGIEDLRSEDSRMADMGEHRPESWFRPFQNVIPRDGRRPFRR